MFTERPAIACIWAHTKNALGCLMCARIKSFFIKIERTCVCVWVCNHDGCSRRGMMMSVPRSESRGRLNKCMHLNARVRAPRYCPTHKNLISLDILCGSVGKIFLARHTALKILLQKSCRCVLLFLERSSFLLAVGTQPSVIYTLYFIFKIFFYVSY